jgi:hypothetical protein
MSESKQAELLYYRYAGCIASRSNSHRFCHQSNGIQFSKSFSTQKYGSMENARRAAESFQEEYSDQRNLTTLIFAADGKEEVRRYLIGFAEGDGGIFVSKAGHVKVLVGQSQEAEVPKVLLMFQSMYGGIIEKKRKPHGKNNHRQAYHWVCFGIQALPILKDWIQFGVLKRNQAKAVFDFMLNNDHPNCAPIYSQLHTAKSLQSYREVEIDDSVLTVYYLAGFFDADGCASSLNGTDVRVIFTQWSSLNLLDSINNFFQDLGTITERNLRFFGKSAERVLKELLPYLVVKAEQAKLALEILKYAKPRGKRYSEAERTELENLRERLKALKKT